MALKPTLVMVAGPNGSGKSTLAEALRSDTQARLPRLYINADDIQRQHKVDVRVAQGMALEQRSQAVSGRHDLMFETVMSHPSRLAELQRARVAGYSVIIHFVATDDASINVQRVALRVAAGGHPVPEDRVRDRYTKTLALAPVALRYADQALVFDNTCSDGSSGLELQALMIENRLTTAVAKVARWVEHLVLRTNERLDELDRIQHDFMKSGLPLVDARLDDGTTVGPITMAGQYMLVQSDIRTRSYVIHERMLVGDLELGRRCAIVYCAGEAQVTSTA